MKKLLTLTAVGATLAMPALAVQKCVALGETSHTYSNGSTSTSLNSSEWGYTLSSAGLDVRGIGVCTNISGNLGSRKENLSYTSNDGGTYCWCRIIYPVASNYWASAGAITSTSSPCYMQCSMTCAYKFKDDSTFRAAILNGGFEE